MGYLALSPISICWRNVIAIVGLDCIILLRTIGLFENSVCWRNQGRIMHSSIWSETHFQVDFGPLNFDSTVHNNDAVSVEIAGRQTKILGERLHVFLATALVAPGETFFFHVLEGGFHFQGR
jgi:hypothetical protein